MSKTNFWPWIPEPRPATCPECGVEGMLVCDELLVLEGGLPHMQHGVGCLENQLAKLQAIVDRLVKTKDGAPVIVEAGRMLWCRKTEENRIIGRYASRFDWEDAHTPSVISAYWYSTRAAAEAAKEPQKGTGNDD